MGLLSSITGGLINDGDETKKTAATTPAPVSKDPALEAKVDALLGQVNQLTGLAVLTAASEDNATPGTMDQQTLLILAAVAVLIIVVTRK